MAHAGSSGILGTPTYRSDPQQYAPPPDPPINISNQLFTFTKEQFDELMLSYQSEETPQKSSTKDLKFGNPRKFTGQAKEVEDFFRECELRFKLQEDIYDTVDKQVYYALSLFEGRTADLWKKSYFRDREEEDDGLAPGGSWRNFKKAVEDSFPETGKLQEAMQRLETIRQGKMSIDEFKTKFRIVLSDAGFSTAGNDVFLVY